MFTKRFIAVLSMLVCVQLSVLAQRKVLICEGTSADEKMESARKNRKIAMEMIKKAQKAGHVIKDKNGLYKKVCGNECECLPLVPSAVK